jgi:hypothetical protein
VRQAWVLLVVLFGMVVRVGATDQHTEGWCSPAVADTKGNVTINCQGVDPKALQRLNELLDKKDLELQAKLKEADEWARKYKDLEQRLSSEDQSKNLTRQARTLLAGLYPLVRRQTAG